MAKKKITPKFPINALVICVEAQDIKGARRSDPEKCPVARAIRRTFNLPVRVSLDTKDDCKSSTSWKDAINHRVSLKGSNSLWIFKIPSSVVLKIQNYDDGGEMKPFTFELKV